jgi:hypothetical protein
MNTFKGNENIQPARQPLRLSEVRAQLRQDLSTMFGSWKEADHCDKDDRVNSHAGSSFGG